MTRFRRFSRLPAALVLSCLAAGCEMTPPVDRGVADLLPQDRALAILMQEAAPVDPYMDPCRVTPQGVIAGSNGLLPFNTVRVAMEHRKTLISSEGHYAVSIFERGLFPTTCSYMYISDSPDPAAALARVNRVTTAFSSLGVMVSE